MKILNKAKLIKLHKTIKKNINREMFLKVLMTKIGDLSVTKNKYPKLRTFCELIETALSNIEKFDFKNLETKMDFYEIEERKTEKCLAYEAYLISDPDNNEKINYYAHSVLAICLVEIERLGFDAYKTLDQYIENKDNEDFMWNF